MRFEEVCDRLAAAGIKGPKAEDFWLAVRGNLAAFGEVFEWWQVVAGEIEPNVEDADVLAAARDTLPEEPWDEATFAHWTGLLKGRVDRKGKALYHPLRLALTGREQGPELAALLPLIGRAKAEARLSGRAA
jgi:glutamyl-tRNA synthetase